MTWVLILDNEYFEDVVEHYLVVNDLTPVVLRYSCRHITHLNWLFYIYWLIKQCPSVEKIANGAKWSEVAWLLRTPLQVLISFTYIVRFPLVDRYWLRLS